MSELKEDFYKRYETSCNYLHFSANGILCPLLGYTEFETAQSLSCSLSMRVQMLARSLDGGILKVGSVASDKCFSYDFTDPASLFSGVDAETVRIATAIGRGRKIGAQILYECSIPECLPRMPSFSLSLTQSIIKLLGAEADINKTAEWAAGKKPIYEYLALAAARAGYITRLRDGVTKNLPLPLSGYKIVSAHCRERDADRSKSIARSLAEVHRVFPSVTSLSQLSPEMLESCPHLIKNGAAKLYMRHIAEENERIERAARALEQCRVNVLFDEMNKSLLSAERCMNIGPQHLFLARAAARTDGVTAVRLWQNGIAAIVEDDKVDYAIREISSSFENNIGYRPVFCVSSTM